MTLPSFRWNGSTISVHSEGRCVFAGIDLFCLVQLQVTLKGNLPPQRDGEERSGEKEGAAKRMKRRRKTDKNRKTAQRKKLKKEKKKQ